MEQDVFQKTAVRLAKVLIIFLLLAVCNSFLQVLVISQDQKIKGVKIKINIMEKELSRVKAEIASLESFNRIQTIALNELGMRTADASDYHFVEVLPLEREYSPDKGVDTSEVAKADLWAQLSIWLWNIGKTMAQGL